MTNFQGFVSENIESMDELARRYGGYRIEVVRSYIDELLSHIRDAVPDGYQCVGNDSVKAETEHICGWFRDFQISGISKTAIIAFGFHTHSIAFAGGWPLMNRSCWTGIKILLPVNVRQSVLARAHELTMNTEPNDNPWILWRFWDPLSAATVTGLHMRLVGEDRVAGQKAIVDELHKWRSDFESIVLYLNRAQRAPEQPS